ncbi:MAG: two-component sensor histidine kinase [Hyphomonadaceae bacterium]|nr:MAG: two-component system OmpR family osmolarity sensor histidine kinase EnvZ [Caulobacteraceae bacterium]MBT9446271.1 two-component sensor histidine kinase [Hyphomonadaceae bacterium]TPW08892.1 MAG: two-component system, OmpR family, osmolarity sensor histidine kinase EnvZ [Alphaproteobacteria bacterium]
MANRRLRDILPKGLYWRTLLIIAAPAAILQLIITIVFLNDHWEATSKRMSQAVASDVALVIQLYERDPTPARFESIRALAWQPLRLDITLEPPGPLEIDRCNAAGPAIDRYLTTALELELKRAVWYDSTCPGTQVKMRIPISEGVLSVKAFRDRVQARSGPLFVLWIFGATAFLVIVSIVFIRNQVRPIEKLAAAMEQFGRGEDPGVFGLRGAREVRGATLAFFDMRRRIRKHVDQRGQLLAGVSHDLRTPLTRLKLQFALMPPSPDLDAAKQDLADMEATLDEYLTFAQGQWSEAPEAADIGAIVADATAATARAGGDVTFEQTGDLTVPVRAGAVKRALVNLIDNAASHGEKVRVSARRVNDMVIVDVDDNGPGIPENLYEDAFRPFSRLDATRTKNTKGVGLGLAIARDVARSHGGDVVLSKSALGGLRATLRLPTAVGDVGE